MGTNRKGAAVATSAEQTVQKQALVTRLDPQRRRLADPGWHARESLRAPAFGGTPCEVRSQVLDLMRTARDTLERVQTGLRDEQTREGLSPLELVRESLREAQRVLGDLTVMADAGPRLEPRPRRPRATRPASVMALVREEG